MKHSLTSIPSCNRRKPQICDSELLALTIESPATPLPCSYDAEKAAEEAFLDGPLSPINELPSASPPSHPIDAEIDAEDVVALLLESINLEPINMPLDKGHHFYDFDWSDPATYWP